MISHLANFTIGSFPFNYLVIENLFDEGLACALSTRFEELIQHGKAIGKVGEEGDLIYDALNYTPTLAHTNSTPIQALVSIELKNLIAEIFGIAVDENVMIGMHRHNPPSKAGWTHTDFSICSFPNIPQNCGHHRTCFPGCGCNYSDDSKARQPNSIKTARAIACLYYTCNPDWMPGMGGETGLYLRDRTTLSTTIPPKNNSLLAFEINPYSFHAYQGSQSMRRSSYIWWYHAPPGYLMWRYRDMAAAKQASGLDPWDRWTDQSVEKYQFDAYSV